MGLARGIGTPRGNRVRICASFPRMARGFGAPRGRRVERVPNPLANTTSDALPPNSDCLLKHIERANLQAACWSQSLTPQQNLPSAVDNGWKMIDGQLDIDWMSRTMAPLNCIHCKMVAKRCVVLA